MAFDPVKHMLAETIRRKKAEIADLQIEIAALEDVIARTPQ